MEKNLELKTTTVNGPRRELNFIFDSPMICIYSFVYSQTRRMFALKGSFGFDLIIPMDSLTFIPFSCCEKIYEEFDNVCTPNKLD